METYSLRIENLLCKLSPKVKGMRAIIARNPYEEIFNVLNGRISTNSLEKFVMKYQGILGKSITDLQLENYNIDAFIFDLQTIIENSEDS